MIVTMEKCTEWLRQCIEVQELKKWMQKISINE